MAETKSPQEPALSAKRRPDLTSQEQDQDQENLPHKSPKLQTQDERGQAKEGNHVLQPSGNNDCSIPESRPENEEPGNAEEEEEEEEEEDEDDDYEDDDGDEEEEENGNTSADRKGKGILIEEENDSDEEDDDDDDDDSSDGGNESEGESDLSDDPLAEVDLDNILPSRTRRRVVHPGVHIANDVRKKGEGDDSDDSDA